MRTTRLMLAAAVPAALALTACTEKSFGPDVMTVGAAYYTAPAGFSTVSSSFSASGDAERLPWQPEFGFGGPWMSGRGMGGPPMGGGPDFGGPGRDGPGMGGLMAGGMDGNFTGSVERGRGGPMDGPFGHGDDLTGCTFAGGVVTCPPKTFGGLTTTRILTIKKLDGTAQGAVDSTTNSIRTQITSSGTVTRREGVTATVSHTSDRTVTGLLASATVRTVNGTASGKEDATGTTKDGVAFTSHRETSDKTEGLTIPVQNGKPTYPSAGKVTRTMVIAMTSGGNTTNSSRSEVITYDGTATAKLVITQDGTTKTCTVALPMGRPNCP